MRQLGRYRFAGHWAAVAIMLSMVTGCGGGNEADPAREVRIDPANPPAKAELMNLAADDWPWWRGPHRNGVSTQPDFGRNSPAVGAPTPPTTFNDNLNVAWKVEVPGRGHSSPTVVGEQVFLTTAIPAKEQQLVLAYDRKTGDENWQAVVHTGGLPNSKQQHAKASDASCTVASDGTRLFVSFLNSGHIFVTALDAATGDQVWQRDLGSYSPRFGYSPSPAVYQSYVIVAADHGPGGLITALHRETGETVWLTNRPGGASYASPLVVYVAGKNQCLLPGLERVCSYNPDTGEKLWEVAATTESCAGTVTYAGSFVYASGGYPGSETVCIRADGSGEIIWKNDVKLYVPSPLVYEGVLYAVADGRVQAFEADSGKQLWRGRLPGGSLSASPVIADGKIYAINERGTCYVFRANREEFDLLAENQLGDEAFATPTIIVDKIYLRVATGDGESRQEFLYCVRSPVE